MGSGFNGVTHTDHSNPYQCGISGSKPFGNHAKYLDSAFQDTLTAPAVAEFYTGEDLDKIQVLPALLSPLSRSLKALFIVPGKKQLFIVPGKKQLVLGEINLIPTRHLHLVKEITSQLCFSPATAMAGFVLLPKASAKNLKSNISTCSCGPWRIVNFAEVFW